MSLKDKRHQFSLALAIASLGLLGFLTVMLFGDKLRPTASNTPPPTSISTTATNANTNTNWNVPVRYAFVTDKNSPKMAIFDTYSQTIVSHIALKTQADSVAISAQGGFIVYAKHGQKKLYRLDLDNLSQTAISTEATIEQLIVHASGQWLAYTSADKVFMKNLNTGKETSLNTQGEVSLLYAPSGQWLFINEMSKGKVTRINLNDQQQQVLFEVGKPISPMSIMPNMMAFFFSAEQQLYRYSLLDEVLNNYPQVASSERPYITAESRNLLTVSQSGNPELLLVNAYTQAVKQRYPLDNITTGDDKIATGWLEQTAVVIGKKSLESIDLSNNQQKDTPLSGKLIDQLVQADSKTLLATIANSSKLLLFDMKSQQITKQIATGLTQPNHVLMGQTATLCH